MGFLHHSLIGAAPHTLQPILPLEKINNMMKTFQFMYIWNQQVNLD